MSKKKSDGITMSGADYREFYHDRSVWGERDEGWLDEDDICVNGVIADFAPTPENCPDSAIVTFSYGAMVDGPHNGEDLTDVARKWLLNRTYITLTVCVKKDDIENLKAAIKAAGGRVLA